MITKEQIEGLCRQNLTMVSVAATLGLQDRNGNTALHKLKQLLILHFPFTEGRWTELRASCGLDPYEHCKKILNTTPTHQRKS